jgi:hypothetical protein
VLLNFRHKSKLACDLNAKYPFWIVQFQILQVRFLDLFDVNEFEISVLKYPTHYSPTVTYSTLLFIRISDYHVWSFLISWTQINYPQYSTYWIT